MDPAGSDQEGNPRCHRVCEWIKCYEGFRQFQSGRYVRAVMGWEPEILVTQDLAASFMWQSDDDEPGSRTLHGLEILLLPLRSFAE